MNEYKPTIKIYRADKLDYVATYKPVAKKLFNKVDYLFVNGHWPSMVE